MTETAHDTRRLIDTAAGRPLAVQPALCTTFCGDYHQRAVVYRRENDGWQCESCPTRQRVRGGLSGWPKRF